MADTFVKNPVLLVGEKDKVVAQMGENDLGVATDVEFYTKQEVDDLVAQSGGASLPILLSVLSDHVLNDISWLRADTFSWQSGDVYVAAYSHLAADFDSKQGTKWYSWGYMEDYYTFYTLSAAPAVGDLAFAVEGENIVSVVKITAYTPETEDGVPATITLDGIAFNSRGELFEVKPFVDFAYDPNVSAYAYVLYYVAEDGHKICMPDQESNVSEMYEATGAADYYILDTTNKQFKLPRNYQPKRTLIRTANNADGTWYKLYSDGWVEQGGYDSTDFNTRTWTYPIAMSDTNYTLTLSVGYVNIDTQNGKFGVTSRTETGFSYKVISLGGNAVGDNMSWRVEGYSAVQGGGVQRKYEYYYVGNFTQEAIEQTAGINTELFNGKADVDLGNIPANYDYVVESQLPTADNGYTWYRKYKSGWVEMGGLLSGRSVTFPIEFAQIPTLVFGNYSGTSSSTPQNAYSEITTTGFTGWRTRTNAGWDSGAEDWNGYWQASGMAAQ